VEERLKQWLKWLAIGVAGLAAAGISLVTIVYLITEPEGPPDGSASAAALAAGDYGVGEAELTLVDASRPTPENGSYAGADSRTLVTHLWYPDEPVEDGSPLVIYSHGFMSNREEGVYLAEALARQGYIVAAPDFPLSNGGAPGGPNAADVVNQPGDVSFLIDTLTAPGENEMPFPGTVDASRIGVAGLSLGGLTSTLVGYHPRFHDDRIRAVISIAGPAGMFTRRFFLTRAAPFLMIAGTEDAVVDFETHAAIIPDRAPQGTLVAIRGGTHIAFAGIAEPAMRFVDHPDSVACDALVAGTEDGEGENPFAGLGDLTDGVNPDQTRLTICANPLGKTVHPGRQQMITQVAVVSFFASQFAEPAAARQAARSLLNEEMARDFPEVSVHR
jgi:predicted dienelactone hydrolase